MRRTAGRLKQQLVQRTHERYKTHVMLLAVLAQKGGEVTITQGTLSQVMAGIASLSYTVTPSEIAGESTVRLVTKEATDAQETNAVTETPTAPEDAADQDTPRPST